MPHSAYVQEANQEYAPTTLWGNLEGDHQLRLLTNAIALQSFSALKAKLLHSLGAAAADRLPLGMFLGLLATMLTPVFFFALLAFLFETNDNVNGTSDMHVSTGRLFDGRCDSSGGDVGDGRTSNIEVFEKRVRCIWERCSPLHMWTLSKTSRASPEGKICIGRRATR